MHDNLERRARAICAADLATAGIAAGRHPEMIERYWPVVAAEIGQRAADGAAVQWPADMEQRTSEYQELIGRIAR